MYCLEHHTSELSDHLESYQKCYELFMETKLKDCPTLIRYHWLIWNLKSSQIGFQENI